MPTFRVKFEYADRPGDQSADVEADTPDEAKAFVQKVRGGCRLIWHRVKVLRGETASN
jgi:hypothetical protein